MKARRPPAPRPPATARVRHGVSVAGMLRWWRPVVLGWALEVVALRGHAEVWVVDAGRLTNALPTAAALSFAANVGLSVTVLRLIPGDEPAPDADALERTGDLFRAVAVLTGGPVPAEPKARSAKTAGKTPSRRVETLYHGRQPVLLVPEGRATFTMRETRPTFVATGDPAQGITNREYGLVLTVTVQAAPPEPTGAAPTAPALLLRWEGTFAWSQALLYKWEKYALAAYQTLSRLPGITYQSQTEDEDGFVNRSDGIDLSRLFRRRKKAPPASAPAAAKPADPGTPAGSEPSYLADEERREVPFMGERTVSLDGLVVVKFPVADAQGSLEQLYVFVATQRLP